MTTQRELISRKLRNEFRDICASWGVVRQIERAFEDEGFDRPPNGTYPEDVWRDGQRRGIFSLYTLHVDWTDPVQVRRLLPVFQEILSWVVPENETAEAFRKKIETHLRQDGFEVSVDGTIVETNSHSVATIPLELVQDPSALLGLKWTPETGHRLKVEH